MEAVLGQTTIALDEMLWRIAAATACGLVLGLDRQMRKLSAGIGPHMLVALASAVTMLIVLELHGRALGQGASPPDPTRTIHSLAIAAGILCSGVVFVSKGHVYGLTTAASLWMTSTLGVAVGAGFYRIALAGLLFAVLALTGLWFVTRRLPASSSAMDDRSSST
jgi:putative Mg2+ transporter-C (MgtC) family protein